MKKLLLILVVVGFISHAADDNHDGSNTENSGQRTQAQSVKDKTKKLFDLIGACMTSRPVVSDTFQAGDAESLPALSEQGAAAQPVVGGGDGAAVFQSKCLSCHANNGKPIASKSGTELLKKFPLLMPPPNSGVTLTDNEKAALTTFFNNKK